jgi:hypothetical protein
MSSGTARNAFRMELAVAFPALPQFETLAARVDNTTLPDLWASSDFIPISDAPISIGAPSCCRELGTFRCYVVGRTGAGDATVVSQADAIAGHFRRWRDSSGRIRVTGHIPPAPSDFSDGRWLICAVDFAFAHDYFV